jgi:hypothetical protein
MSNLKKPDSGAAEGASSLLSYSVKREAVKSC